MTENAPKKFRLSFVNAAEDVPRLVRAYGRACQGEFALVLRPPEQRGVLVLVRKDGAMFWRSGASPAPDTRHRVAAEVVRHADGTLRLSPTTVGSGGAAWLPYDATGLRAGQRVTMEFHPDDQFAHVVQDHTPPHSDAPAVPVSPVSSKDAVMLIKTEQKATPKPGPITLKGQWSGWLHCDAGTPRVELVRKLAAYGVLTISSSPEGWSWSVARTEKWFSKPGSDTGSAATLLKAIEAGLARAMGLLGEACSVRDSRRRAALDTSFAADHPIKPAKEGKDPIERLKPKEPRKTKARTPPTVDAPVSLPDAPVTAPALKQMADEVNAEADALAAIRDLPWVWQESSAKDDAVAWFAEVGLEDISDEIKHYDGGPDRPLDAFIDFLRDNVTAHDLDELTKQDALGQLSRLHEGWRTAPALLERARRLVRYAARMSESDLCRGREREEAVGAVQRAVQSYGEARDAIARGEQFDGLRKLRSIAQWVALAAAKAAKACAAGQVNLPTESASTPDHGLEPGDRASLAKHPSRVGTILEWRDDERVVWQEDGQMVRAVLHPSQLRAAVEVDAAPSAVPAKKPAAKHERKPRTAKVEAPVVVAEPEVDAAKDKALIDAFSAAVAAALASA
jgi:hypothetical protein